MKLLGNYLWMFITIPLLAIIIYILARTVKLPKEKAKGMTGICIISIVWGIITLLFWIVNRRDLNSFYLFSGIWFMLLGSLRLLYDYKLKKRNNSIS